MHIYLHTYVYIGHLRGIRDLLVLEFYDVRVWYGVKVVR
jgi:hypothetical protein